MTQKMSAMFLSLVLLLLWGCDTPFDTTSDGDTLARPLAPGYSSITAVANNRIVSADDAGTSPLVADRTAAEDWESFTIVTNSDGTVSFRSKANNLYVAADLNQGTRLIARSSTIQGWEKFRYLPQSDGTVAFQALANNLYVCADLNQGAVLFANRTAIAGWEKFIVTTAVSPSPSPSQAPAPDFGPNVLIFGPSTPASTIQSQVNSVFNQQETAQFGSGRYALLFKPGSYNVDVNVGYYTQVAGLGYLPDDVTINGAVRAEADWFQGNATQNFWRAIENLAIVPSGGTNRWAVSQAAPFRRVHVRGSMILDDGGWSSGGFISDSVIDNQINSGSQQQWYTRNSRVGSWVGSNWNMFFQGVVNAPSGANWPNPPYTVIAQTPVVREKPFLYINSSGNYFVFVPGLRSNSSGTTWEGGAPAGESIGIDQFHIAKAGVDTASSLNAALSQGKNLLFTPGIYHLNDTIRVTRANTVILGLGLATLIPDNGVVAMTVADVDGVKVAGLLFDAGVTNSPVLMEVGPSGSSANHAANPTSLHDVFFRIGGAAVGKATVSLRINSNDVIGDHFWVWRADHGDGVGWNTNTTTNGLIVNGNNVTIYGLFVEHFHQYQTLWNGNGGRVYFYQCEIPYDPPNQASWMNGSVNGYSGYKVSNSVTTHEAWGLGLYCYFNVNPSVKLANAIEAPNTSGVRFHRMITVSLGGVGEITRVINNTGPTANAASNVARVADYP